MTKAAENQIYGKLSSIPGNWAVVDQPVVSAPVTKVSDGGAPEENLFGKRTFGEMTISRPFDPARDAPVVTTLQAGVGKLRDTFTLVVVDPDGTVLSTKAYSVALASVTPPKGDAQSSAPATLQAVLAVDGVA